jgi:hypothetical protein
LLPADIPPTEIRATKANSQKGLLIGRESWLPTLVVAAVFLLLAFRLFRLISLYAVNIFFSDQWDFNDITLFERRNLWQMFNWQHGPHRQGVGAIVQVLVEPLLRWNSRGEAFVAGAIVTLAAVCALYLKKRLRGRISYADVVIPLIFLTPAQYESLWITPNFSHGPLPLLLVILYCLTWTCHRAALRYPLLLLVNFLAVYTGFGLFIGFLTPVLLIVDYWIGRSEAPVKAWQLLLALALSLLSIGSFFSGYVSQPAAGCFATQSAPLAGYGAFAALMLAHFAGARETGTIDVLAGSLLLAAMLATLTWSGASLFFPKAQHKRQYLLPAILISFCLLFCFGTAYGRLCLGLGTAQSSRYTNYVTLGMLGIYLSMLSLDGRTLRTVLLTAVAVVSIKGSLPIARTDREVMQGFHGIKSIWRACYLEREDIEQCDRQAGFGVYPSPEATRLKEKLEYLKRTRQNLYSDLR